MSYAALEQAALERIKSIDKKVLTTVLYTFLLINLAFLFHSINFMFGDHDWNYVRRAVSWNEGSFEGRPLHFLLQNILFGGNVYPILNNLVSFFAMALSGILLAKYWKIPFSRTRYILFGSFIAILPYTLVWLYYSKDTLINLSLPLVCLLGILSGEKGKYYHFLSILLIFTALASYVAVVQFIGIVICGKILMMYIYEDKKWIDGIKAEIPLILDIIVAMGLYMMVLKTAHLTSDYNTKIIDLSYLPEKIGAVGYAMFSQFYVQLPFMDYKYKMALIVLTLWGVGTIVYHGGYKKCVMSLVLMLLMVFCSKFAYFVADERGQTLAELENFAYVPRLDFYGIVYLYAFALAGLLRIKEIKLQKVVWGACGVLIFMSAVRDMYAQKVWKLGFDAEMKAHERIVSRLESRADFRPEQKYRLLQLGSLSLRSNYYRNNGEEKVSLDLLSTSYTPEFMSHIVYNFYYPQEIFYQNAGLSELSPSGREFLRTRAEVWPADNSLYIDGNIIILILSEEKLRQARQQL